MKSSVFHAVVGVTAYLQQNRKLMDRLCRDYELKGIPSGHIVEIIAELEKAVDAIIATQPDEYSDSISKELELLLLKIVGTILALNYNDKLDLFVTANDSRRRHLDLCMVVIAEWILDSGESPPGISTYLTPSAN